MSTASSARISYWQILRRAPGNRFLLGVAASAFGDSLVPLAMAFTILHLTGSVALLGLSLGLSRVPALLVILLGGVAGDRLRARRLVVATNTINCVLNLVTGLALLVLAPTPAVMVMITAQLLAISAGQFGGPATARVLRLLFTEGEEVNAAAGFANTARQAMHIGAQGASGLLVFLGSPAACFFINFASYLVFLLLLPQVNDGSPRTTAQARRPSIRADFVEGLLALRERPQFAWALANTVTCWLLLVQPFLVLTPAVLDAIDRQSAPAIWAAIGICIGLGGIVGGLAADRFRPPDRPTAAVVVALTDIPLLVVLATMPGHWLVYPLAAVTGAQSIVARIWISQELYAIFPTKLVARAQSLVSAAWLLPAVISSLLTPLVAEVIGARQTLALLVIMFLPIWSYMVLKVFRLSREKAGYAA